MRYRTIVFEIFTLANIVQGILVFTREAVQGRCRFCVLGFQNFLYRQILWFIIAVERGCPSLVCRLKRRCVGSKLFSFQLSCQKSAGCAFAELVIFLLDLLESFPFELVFQGMEVHHLALLL